MGALFSSAMFLGTYNASSVQPIIAAERNVFYRERAAGDCAGLVLQPSYVRASLLTQTSSVSWHSSSWAF